MTQAGLVKKSAYQDSVALLALARDLRTSAGVREVAALMGTPANHDVLRQSGLLTAEAERAGPNDLVIVVEADSESLARAALARAEELLAATERRLSAAGRVLPRTMESAHRQLPGANLALISVPGAWAAAEARKALRLGLHVMLFSDHVSVEDEVVLKRLARDRGLLLMGPDCGTAYLSGAPLGFANAVPRGRIGLVAASGTGLQQVACLLAARGEGISQAIGVGGRDMNHAVGGLMTLGALDALGDDAETELVIVIGKPPSPEIRRQVEDRLRGFGKPAVVALLGGEIGASAGEKVQMVSTLEDAAEAALAALRHEPWTARPFSGDSAAIGRRIAEARRTLGPGPRSVHGLYAGGTLAYEALLLLEPLLGPVSGNLRPRVDSVHRIVDLGADEFTLGRAHPMIDPTSRIDAITALAKDSRVAVLLLDIVLGHGAAADPAGDLLPALRAARERARQDGRALHVVASVIGTEGDPQGLSSQVAKLESAGAWVLPSNAQAARAAAAIANPEP
ncbi:MAG TPA: acyl-CoA synthetase FdrA [Methylomirabilota bacterium]|nr:acyl-CoA synthetase FdrA [Methylomirabilota bacterium]